MAAAAANLQQVSLDCEQLLQLIAIQLCSR
jgi:hypothetical protein